MEAITILVPFVFGALVFNGLAVVLLAAKLTRRLERGRGVIILLSFFLPSLYLGYLFFAGDLRNEYHRTHSKAYVLDDFNTLVLGDGYTLWYFDETPWMSSIAASPSQNAEITNIQRFSIDGTVACGQTGRTSMLDGPTDFFFSLNLASNALSRFKTESDLKSAGLPCGTLRRPEDVYNDELDREHSVLFWPIICLAPFALAFGIWGLAGRWRRGATMPYSQLLSE